MPKVRLALLGVLAVYAVSIAASSTASAALQEFWDCQNVGSTEGRWNNSHCNARGGGSEEWATRAISVIGPESVEGTSGESKLEGTILAKKITIICHKDVFSGTLEKEGSSSGEVKFKECQKVIIEGVESTVCSVKEPIEFKFTDQLIHNATTGAIEDEFKATKAEEVFVEIKIEGSGCALNGVYKVKGTQVCELPEARTSLVTHQIVCKPEGSKLKLGTEAAKFTSNEHVNVVGGPQWGAA